MHDLVAGLVLLVLGHQGSETAPRLEHLRVTPPGAASPALVELDAALPALAARLGRPAGSPIEVVVEKDHVEQGRRTGDIGPAIVFEGRLHVVEHPADLDWWRVALASVLVRRADLDLPPLLEEGAALWLAERWYGRHYDAWIEDLAFAEVLPSAAELTAAERPGDGSRVLWLPVAAALLDRLPGETLLDKLGRARRGGLVTDAALAKLDERPASRRPAASLAADRPMPFQRGISFAMANGLETGYHAPGVDAQLERLRRLGADAVSLMPFAYQPRPDQPRLAFLNRSPRSETDVGLVHAARRAREQGFFVLWKPHIWVSHHSWPGDIAMTSEVDWRAWWRSYRRYLVHHAVLARFAGADMLSVGVELGKTVEREDDWRHLVASVRRVYPGPLTYAGNWHGDYDRVGFWDALDVVGVDAYFPLAGSADATDAELRAGAEKVAARLAQDARRWRRPILLTEVGFAAREGAWVSPHEEGGEISDEHQRRAWSALLEALGRPAWLRGLYAWKVFSHERAENAERPDFRFLERPAAAELGRYFQGESRGATTSQ